MMFSMDNNEVGHIGSERVEAIQYLEDARLDQGRVTKRSRNTNAICGTGLLGQSHQANGSLNCIHRGIELKREFILNFVRTVLKSAYTSGHPFTKGYRDTGEDWRGFKDETRGCS